jgi:membrane protease YdiL (CAAX protease family)
LYVQQAVEVGRVGGVPVNRTWSVVQMLAMLVALEGALWSQGTARVYWYSTALVILVGSVLLSHPRVRELGIGLRGMWQSAWTIPLSALVCLLAALIARWLGTAGFLHEQQTVYWHSILYAIWALEQEFILNSFFYNRFESLLGNTTSAVVTTALLFSLVHLPNPVLVPATFLGGLFFVEVFRRWRNIYPLAIVHAMFGLTLGFVFPDQWIRHMRVGLAFLHFHVRG